MIKQQCLQFKQGPAGLRYKAGLEWNCFHCIG